LVAPFPGGALVAVVDGLGHGDQASFAARTAVNTLKSLASEHPIPLVLRCHLNLQVTRGVAMSVASFNIVEETMTWLGVGSVEGALIRGNRGSLGGHAQECLLRSGGIVGSSLPMLRAPVTPVRRGDTLILATDGIRSEFLEHLELKAAPQKSAEEILVKHGKRTDEALVLVVRYMGPKE
jgi:serine/threonine protein phosphatase PrpC